MDPYGVASSEAFSIMIDQDRTQCARRRQRLSDAAVPYRRDLLYRHVPGPDGDRIRFQCTIQMGSIRFCDRGIFLGPGWLVWNEDSHNGKFPDNSGRKNLSQSGPAGGFPQWCSDGAGRGWSGTGGHMCLVSSPAQEQKATTKYFIYPR